MKNSPQKIPSNWKEHNFDVFQRAEIKKNSKYRTRRLKSRAFFSDLLLNVSMILEYLPLDSGNIFIVCNLTYKLPPW